MTTRTKLVTIGVTVSALSLAGCKSGTTSFTQFYNNHDVACATSIVPSIPVDNVCGNNEWDEYRALWQCDDNTSNYYKYYSYDGFLNKAVNE